MELYLSSLQMALLSSTGLSYKSASNLLTDTIFGHLWKPYKESCCCGLIVSETVKRNGEWIQFFSNEGILLLQNFESFSKLSSNQLMSKENALVDLYKSKQCSVILSIETCINLLQIGMIVYKSPDGK